MTTVSHQLRLLEMERDFALSLTNSRGVCVRPELNDFASTTFFFPLNASRTFAPEGVVLTLYLTFLSGISSQEEVGHRIGVLVKRKSQYIGWDPMSRTRWRGT